MTTHTSELPLLVRLGTLPPAKTKAHTHTHTHRQWANCFSYYREIRLIKKQLPSPRRFSVLFTTCSLITYADVSRAILATWINELYVVQRNLCNRSHLSAYILQHKARGQSTAVQLPLLAALAILANGQLNQPYGSGDFHLSPPSLVIQSSRQWPVVHFRLCGTILGAARMNKGLRHGGMNSFSHIYNHRGSPWQVPFHWTNFLGSRGII